MNTPRIRTYKTEAVVLKQTPLSEADRILTLLTPDLGKVRAVAKGVRRTKSRLAGHLELLSHASVSLTMGRNLDTVNEAQGLNSFRAVRDDLQRVSMGLYIAELTDAFSTEGAASYSLFHRVLRTLSWLGNAQNPELLVRHFELHLLVDSGYEPEIIDCVECRETLEPADHLFAPMSGGVLCPGCRKHSSEALIPLSMNAMKVFRFLRRESLYDKADTLEVAPSLVSELERLLRNYIRFILEKELKSAEFMNLVR